MKRGCILLIMCIPLFGKAQATLPDSIVSMLTQRNLDTAQIDQLNEYANSLLRESPLNSRELITRLLSDPQLNYQRGKARALTILGNTYWSEGAYSFALRYYLQSAREYERVNDSLGLSRTYNNIGEVYKKINEYEKSLEYLLYSLSLKKNKAPITLYNVGELYLFLNNYEKANAYFHESLDAARDMKDERAIAYCQWGLGKIKLKEENFNDAISLFRLSLESWKALGDIRVIIQLHQEIGSVYVLQRNFQNAKISLEESTRLAYTLNVPDLRLKNYYLAYTIDSTQGNLSSALQILYRYNSLKDSLYTLQKAEQISRLQTIYETETRARENQDLRYQQSLTEVQLKNQRIIIFAISIGLVLATIMAFLLFRQQKQILINNRQLGIKNKKISIQNQAIQNQTAALKKLNQELTDLNKNLETRIHERTQQLYLQNQKLTDYAFVNAHKLRAPVATILGLINLIDRLPLDEIPEALKHLKNCSDQLDIIIHDLSTDLEGGIVDT